MDNKSNKLKESYETTVLEPYTAGFIKEDGSFIIADIYDDYIHGDCAPEILEKHYPEFSNTHPEEDTCVRIMKEPNEIQYKKLEEIIDKYLDWEGYCKIEVWEVNDRNPHLYEVCSLFEGACQAYHEEEKVDNWTGYKLVQKIKNYFKGKIDEKIVHLSNNKWQVQSEKGRNMGTYDTKKEAEKRLGQVEYFKHMNESTRATLISKSKSADKYANGKGSRWTQKSKCSVANTVKDYNKINMNSFWKDDELTFDVKVVGETNEYLVTISFKDILPKIQRKIHDNKELLEFKCIYDALIQAINNGDVKISCTCPDYEYRLKYWNSQSGDEAGEKETRKSDKTNPNNSKGPACKHILAVLNNVEWLNKIASVINNYANYCKDNMQYNYSKFIFPKLYGMPYNKAVQMSLEDYDENGEIKDTLGSEEALINLSNALGKDRGKFKKGSNKNPATKKKEESLQESLSLEENFDIPDHLMRHYTDHCLRRKFKNHLLFSDVGINYKTPQEYKEAAEQAASTFKKGWIKLKQDSNGKWVVQYYKIKQIKPNIYLFVSYYKERNKPLRHIETYFVANSFYLGNEQLKDEVLPVDLPEEESNLKSFNEPFDCDKNNQYESELIKKYI